MRAWVLEIPEQLRGAVEQARSQGWPPDLPAPESVVLAGMGGSAMACGLARSILLARAAVPISLHQDASTPGWAGPRAWFLAASYSGDTWETRRMLAIARQRGATVLAVASGGALIEESGNDPSRVFRVPAGYAPRAALGWMFPPVLLALARAGGASDVAGELEEARALLAEEIDLWRRGLACPGRDPRALAREIAGKLCLVYAPNETMRPAAVRWKTQLQENGKQAAAEAAFPEILHNEIMGWESLRAMPALCLLLEAGEDAGADRLAAAGLAAAARELAQAGVRAIPVPARGRSLTARLLSHVALADMTSVELAAARGVDPFPVEAIGRVKASLAASEKSSLPTDSRKEPSE